MNHAALAAHKRLLARLPVRTVHQMLDEEFDASRGIAKRIRVGSRIFKSINAVVKEYKCGRTTIFIWLASGKAERVL